MAIETKYDEAIAQMKDLQRAERASIKAAEARSRLPAGSTRARVTTANARWGTAAAARDRAIDDAKYALEACCLRARAEPVCPESEDGLCHPESDGHCHWCDRDLYKASA